MRTTIVVVVVVLVLIAVVAFVVLPMLRRRKLRSTFGPEYDRAVEQHGDRAAAEAELRRREQRHRSLELREIPEADRARYAREWAGVQEHFVDDPKGAVRDADRLVTTVMAARGYPTEGYEQQLADLSIEHSTTLGHYRDAHDVNTRATSGDVTTEDLRGAMVHYRTLFAELLGSEVTPARTSRHESDGAAEQATGHAAPAHAEGHQPPPHATGHQPPPHATGHQPPPHTEREEHDSALASIDQQAPRSTGRHQS